MLRGPGLMAPTAHTLPRISRMAWTQAQLDAYDAQILAFGVLKQTSFSDQSATARELDEMLKLRALMAASIAGASRTRYAATSKGV